MKASSLIRLACLILFALVFPRPAWSGTFDQDFVVVFIDANTEAKYGAIPLNRNILAEGVEAIARAGARGLVLKFFLDQPKDRQGDQRLAASMLRIPTVLQARLDEAETNPNRLPDRFTKADLHHVAVSGSSGWIPLPIFAAAAQDIGFVDFNSNVVPMVERYQSRIVKSLVLCAIELAANDKAVLVDGKRIVIGSRLIPVNDRNEAVATWLPPQLQRSVPFNSVLNGSAMKDLKDRVVILAYDGPHIHTVETATGPMGAHRYFVNILRSLYNAK